jgi:hypothetical protein
MSRHVYFRYRQTHQTEAIISFFGPMVAEKKNKENK